MRDNDWRNVRGIFVGKLHLATWAAGGDVVEVPSPVLYHLVEALEAAREFGAYPSFRHRGALDAVLARFEFDDGLGGGLKG